MICNRFAVKLFVSITTRKAPVSKAELPSGNIRRA